MLMRLSLAVLAVVLLLVPSAGASAERKKEAEELGAKALFFAPVRETTVVVRGNKPPQPNSLLPRSRPLVEQSPIPPGKPAEEPPTQIVQNPVPDPPVHEAPPSEAPASDAPIGLRYWVKLLRGSGPEGIQVTTDRDFKANDRIQLVLETNVRGHIVLLLWGSNGEVNVLFPRPSQGLTNNLVLPYQKIVLPSPQHQLRFDDQPGLERILVVFSKEQATVEKYLAAGGPELQEVKELSRAAQELEGSKGMLLERISQESDTSTYAVQLGGTSVVHEIRLRHLKG